MGKIERIDWIDFLKGVAITFVVLGHILIIVSEINIYNENHFYEYLRQWIYTWHMPLFITLSGMTYKIIIKRKKIYEKIINLLILYIFFSILNCLSRMFFQNYTSHPLTLATALADIFYPSSLMWYLWTLIIYYIIFSKAIKHSKGNIAAKIYCIVLVAFTILSYAFPSYLKVSAVNTLRYGTFFYFGIVYDYNFNGIKGFKRICWISVIYSVIYIAMKKVYLNSIIFNYINAWAIVFVAIYVAPHIKSGFSRLFSCMCQIGKYSFGIYVFHPYVQVLIKKYITGHRVLISIYIGPFIYTIFVVTVTLLITVIIERIPYFRWVLSPVKGLRIAYHKIQE